MSISMAEHEIRLDPEAFEAVRTGAAPAPLPLHSWNSFRLIEVDGGTRTGRWVASTVGFKLVSAVSPLSFAWATWPPLAACYSRNAAAARIP